MPEWHCMQRGRRAWDQKALSVQASLMLLEGEDFFVRAACSLLLVLPRLLALPASGCGIWLAKRLHQGRPSRIATILSKVPSRCCKTISQITAFRRGVSLGSTA